MSLRRRYWVGQNVQFFLYHLREKPKQIYGQPLHVLCKLQSDMSYAVGSEFKIDESKTYIK